MSNECDRQLIKDIASPDGGLQSGDLKLEARRIKTFANPVRTRILVTMNLTDTESGISVKQLSEKLNMSHGTVFYHVRQLLSVGLIEETGTREVNGIIERFYRPVRRIVRISPEAAAQMDVPVNMYFEETYQQTRKPRGRRSFVDHGIYVDEKQRDEFLKRYVELCAEYGTPGEDKMHLAASLITYEMRDGLEGMPDVENDVPRPEQGSKKKRNRN